MSAHYSSLLVTKVAYAHMAFRRACLSVPVTAILGALIVGCSSASSASVPTSLNGAQLSAALLPASSMPRGFKLDPSGERDTGHSTASDTTQQVPASKECSLLTGTSWIAVGGIVAGSFAQNDYINRSGTEEIVQEADAYHGSRAQQVMQTLWQLFGKCSHFTVNSGDTIAVTTMVRSELSGTGDQAYKAVQTSSVFLGGATLVAIRVGNVIVTCLDTSSGNDKGSAALQYAKRIAANVQAAMRSMGHPSP